MARILNKAAGKVVKKYNDLTRDSAGVLTGPLNKLWRGMILVNRVTTPLPKDTSKKGKLYNPNGVVGESQISSKNPILNDQLHKKWRMELQFPREAEGEGVDPAQGHKNTENYRNFEVPADIRGLNRVRIYNLNSDPVRYIELQNRPMELDFRGETTWATIKSMGRNTPMYHYTGSEDIIQFNISWYCNDPYHPEDVLNKCRLLESWTKSNGYQASPPILKIEWGQSGIFENHYYILTSATYTLKNFQNATRQRSPGTPAVFKDSKLLPAAATQELIFKRVSAYSLGTQDFIDSESINRITGTKK